MTGMELPIDAIQRVEVIRGPGSALYGADAFAGVINIITKKAKDIDGKVLGFEREIIAPRVDGAVWCSVGRLGCCNQFAISAYQWR